MQPNFQYFLAVAETHSFTRAAEKLYISQSALTKYIKRLESSLGTVLFERTTPVQLTYAGELYLQYARRGLRQEEELLQHFQEISRKERGKIRLGISSFRGSVLLPRVLPVYQQRHPKIQIELVERQSPDLVNALINGQLDLCISNPSDIINYTDLIYETLFSEKMLLAVSSDFPRLRRYVRNPSLIREQNRQHYYPVADIAALADEPFLMLQPQQGMAYLVENVLRARNIHLTRTLRTTNLTTAINLSAAGLGFCFVPDTLCAENQLPSDLLLFRFHEKPVIWEHAAFYRKDVLLGKPGRAFIDLIKDLYREHG